MYQFSRKECCLPKRNLKNMPQISTFSQTLKLLWMKWEIDYWCRRLAIISWCNWSGSFLTRLTRFVLSLRKPWSCWTCFWYSDICSWTRTDAFWASSGEYIEDKDVTVPFTGSPMAHPPCSLWILCPIL